MTIATPRTLRRGMTGPDVSKLQKTIGCPVVDGVFGPDTELLLKMWQAANNINPDGVYGPVSRAAADRSDTVPPIEPMRPDASVFIPARYFDRSRYGSTITVIVIHTAETPEGTKTARSVANWFASDMLGSDGKPRKASAHFTVDAHEIVQSVPEFAMAYGAPGANRQGLHVEHAGRASQTAEQWSDAYSDEMLRRSAVLVADLCRRHGIPIKRIGPDELSGGARGICGHDTVSLAFPIKGAHQDPGPNWPWSKYIKLIMQCDGMGDKPHVS